MTVRSTFLSLVTALAAGCGGGPVVVVHVQPMAGVQITVKACHAGAADCNGDFPDNFAQLDRAGTIALGNLPAQPFWLEIYGGGTDCVREDVDGKLAPFDITVGGPPFTVDCGKQACSHACCCTGTGSCGGLAPCP
jgi:hypothetical protein